MSCIDRSADDDVVVIVQVGLLAFVQTKEVKGGIVVRMFFDGFANRLRCAVFGRIDYGYCFLRHGVLCFLFFCFSCEGDIVFYVFTLCGVVRFCVPAGLLSDFTDCLSLVVSIRGRVLPAFRPSAHDETEMRQGAGF